MRHSVIVENTFDFHLHGGNVAQLTLGDTARTLHEICLYGFLKKLYFRIQKPKNLPDSELPRDMES